MWQAGEKLTGEAIRYRLNEDELDIIGEQIGTVVCILCTNCIVMASESRLLLGIP